MRITQMTANKFAAESVATMESLFLVRQEKVRSCRQVLSAFAIITIRMNLPWIHSVDRYTYSMYVYCTALLKIQKGCRKSVPTTQNCGKMVHFEYPNDVCNNVAIFAFYFEQAKCNNAIHAKHDM